MLTETEKDELSRLISATYEVLGQPVTGTAIDFMVGDLSQYPVDAINNALAACRREVKGRFNLAEIINRIESEDGRPSPNEAWGIACSVYDEVESGMVSNEILEALSKAKHCGDKIAARMVFLESYQKICDRGRRDDAKPVWNMSLGSDPHGQECAIERALIAGQLTEVQAENLLPNLSAQQPQLTNLLESAATEAPTNEYAKKAMADLRSMFDKPKRKETKYDPDVINRELAKLKSKMKGGGESGSV